MENHQVHPLAGDLERVLKYEVQFSGAFALSMVIPTCPLPGLEIDGVGRIPLPLTGQTAELIASVGHQAPYGHGTDTIVDPTIRDTIQIDASNIRFLNPNWAPTIQDWVEKEVWSGLGCAPFTSRPRCELYKLLLYKPGAHFLPHKDTEKAPGMFATFVIILPSEFTGGEIHVSHGGEQMVFENAKVSAFETTSLAWYTDVTHEVKAITSGYRLALSYHLIDTSPGITSPHLPSDHSSLQHLHEIFSRWLNNEYPPLKVNQAVGYVFIHQYSNSSLEDSIFKGKDQHVASILNQIGDMKGIIALMGWLNVHIDGKTADHGPQIYEAYSHLPGYCPETPEFGPYTGRWDYPVMSYVFEKLFRVDRLRDMQGKMTRITKIELDYGNIIPCRAFSGVHPDDFKLGEGYYGNEGASVDFMYRQAALVMFPKDKQLSLMLSSEGPEWGLEELEKSKSDGPSRENREIIEFLVQKQREDITTIILKVAIEWKDPLVWGRIIESNPKYFLKQKGYVDLRSGWQAFNFDDVRPTFEKLFQQGDKLKEASMRFLLFVKDELPLGKDQQKDEWISAQAIHLMETFNPNYFNETPVVDIIRWKGLDFASSIVLPRYLDRRFEDMAGFAIQLVKYKEELIALPRVEGQTTGNAELLDHILDKALESWIPQVAHETCRSSVVSSLLSICIPGNRMKPYGDLLGTLILSPQPFYTRYHDLYATIIPHMVKLLGGCNINVSSSPSREFFYHIIGTYLEEILGSKEGSPHFNFSLLTCGHEACAQTNSFLQSEETCITIGTRSLPPCVKKLKMDDLFETKWHYSTPDSVKLTKNKKADAARCWSIRVVGARKLLSGIGTDEEISKIMGERYPDVERALEGSQAFVTSKARREPGTEEWDGWNRVTLCEFL